MRLLGAAHVRNEADIVEAFVRHNLVLLDGIAIVDHASVDATPDILRALKDEGPPIFLARDESPTYDQQAMQNRLVRHLFSTPEAAWVFPIDADEFLRAPSRDRSRTQRVAALEGSIRISRSGRPLTRRQLESFAFNYGVPMERWLPTDAHQLVDDPFLHDFTLRYPRGAMLEPFPQLLWQLEQLLRPVAPS